MSLETLKRVVTIATVVSLVVMLATWSLVLPGVRDLYSPRVGAVVAIGLMALTVLLLATFLVGQALPNGRRVVRVGWLAPDGWFTMLAFTLMPAFSWADLGRLAGPPISWYTDGMAGFVTVLFPGIMFLAARAYQMEREARREARRES